MSSRIRLLFLALALGAATLASAALPPRPLCQPGDPVCQHCGCARCPVCPTCCFTG